MAMETLTLVSNPGSASRKYALFAGKKERASWHFEYVNEKVICTQLVEGKRTELPTTIAKVEDASRDVKTILSQNDILKPGEHITYVGLRVVCPGTYFLHDRVVDDEVEEKLHASLPRAPLHIRASLAELHAVRIHFGEATIVAVSDSAFHADRPDVAKYYGIPLSVAKKHDILRFGYHGLSAESVAATLQAQHRLPEKLVVCHMGSGVSVMAIANGVAVDSTMGYSPLEGLAMATRAGSLDITAAHTLKQVLGKDDAALETYLNTQSGLLGMSGVSSDIRTLLSKEHASPSARLALDVYVYGMQKAIGQMTAVLGGIDMLVFTGAVGERSAPMRQRIVDGLGYLGFLLDGAINAECLAPITPTDIGLITQSKPLWVIPTDEARQIALRAHQVVE